MNKCKRKLNMIKTYESTTTPKIVLNCINIVFHSIIYFVLSIKIFIQSIYIKYRISIFWMCEKWHGNKRLFFECLEYLWRVDGKRRRDRIRTRAFRDVLQGRITEIVSSNQPVIREHVKWATPKIMLSSNPRGNRSRGRRLA